MRFYLAVVVEGEGDVVVVFPVSWGQQQPLSLSLREDLGECGKADERGSLFGAEFATG